MPDTVSDSSTLIHLAGIGRLDLLRHFFGEIFIPQAVFREVVVEGGDRPAARIVGAAVNEGWIRVATDPLPDAAILRENGRLHDGESEAIALILVRGPGGLLLMDEAHGRQVAQQRGISVSGILGVLLRAKQEARIPNVSAELERLRRDSGFYLHDALVQRVRLLAGEA